MTSQRLLFLSCYLKCQTCYSRDAIISSVLVEARLHVEPYGAVVAVLAFNAQYVVFVKGMFCDLMNRQSIPNC